MAKVTVVHRHVTPPPVESVILELTPDEAKALRTVCFAEAPGGYKLNNVWRALAEAGVPEALYRHWEGVESCGYTPPLRPDTLRRRRRQQEMGRLTPGEGW